MEDRIVWYILVVAGGTMRRFGPIIMITPQFQVSIVNSSTVERCWRPEIINQSTSRTICGASCCQVKEMSQLPLGNLDTFLKLNYEV